MVEGLTRKQNEQLEQVKKYAEENDHRISRMVLLDILKYEHQSLPDDEEIWNQVLHELFAEGIHIDDWNEDEDYPVTESGSDELIPARVTIAQPQLNVSNLMERLLNDEIDLTPAFQRHGGLWNEMQQSRLIESLMLRIPIPSFYFDATSEDCWIVIDGLQRLVAFRNYLVNEEKKSLTGLQYLTDFNGKTFDELPRQYIRRIKEASVTVFCVEKDTPKKIVYNIFERINTGGLQLTPQEVRNAMYQGKASALAEELAESREFKEATEYAVNPARMMDQEYIVRFMAFTELDYETEYKDDIGAFLILAMERVNAYSDEKIAHIKENFYKVMRCSKELLGKYAFRRVGMDGRRGPINKALFELCAVCFSELSEEQIASLLEQKDEFEKAYKKIFLRNTFNNALKSGKRTECVKRIAMGRKLIKEFI